MSIILILIVLLLSQTNLVFAKKSNSPTWPPVVKTDRGILYSSVYKNTGSVDYYSFSGIKYGRLINRFSAPAPPCYKSIKKCTRGNPRISRAVTPEHQVPGYPKCPQAIPDWITAQNQTTHQKRESSSKYRLKVVPDDEVEDCLFLDILVPVKVWEQIRSKTQSLAAVLIYIHGGGFTSGDKSLKEDPSPLLARGLDLDARGVIVVSINYRLGLFGFLAGAGNNFASNGGLMDQRMAFSWVQKHIKKFGGDKSRVTLVGEGAGASSILHHLTAPNITNRFFPMIQSKSHHHRKFPFRSAVLQSPKYQPIITSQSDIIFEKACRPRIATIHSFSPHLILQSAYIVKVLTVTTAIWGHKVKNIAKLRLLPYEVLYAVNAALIQESSYGTFTFGPAVDYQKGIDNSYVPDFPLRRLAKGKMAKGVHIIIGQKRNENSFLFPSTVLKDDGLKDHLARIFPTVAKHHINYVSDFLYPSRDYEDMENFEVRRSTEVLYDVFVGCNFHYLLQEMARSSGYVLDTTWAIQERFFEQAFFQGKARDSLGKFLPNTSAHWLQEEILQFSREGASTSKIRPYDGSGKVLLASDGKPKDYIDDPTAKHLCQYWADFRYEDRKCYKMYKVNIANLCCDSGSLIWVRYGE